MLEDVTVVHAGDDKRLDQRLCSFLCVEHEVGEPTGAGCHCKQGEQEMAWALVLSPEVL